MKKLSKEALELFYRLDDKKYLISKNDKLKEWITNLGYDGFEIEIQNFIDKIASWYFVKYSNKYLDTVLKKGSKEGKCLIPDMSLDLLFQKFTLLETKFFEQNKLFIQYLLMLSGYEMIYSKNSIPAYGMTRVRWMFSDFNEYFGWNLDPAIYNEVINRDYSMDNVDNIVLLATLREEQKIKPKTHKKKKPKLSYLFHW